MTYKSKAQEKYFNVNRAKMEKQGVDVGEWNSASKGMKLPDRAKNYKIMQIRRKRRKNGK